MESLDRPRWSVPVKYWVEPELRLVFVVGYGEVTLAETLDSTHALVRTWAPVSHFQVLVDLTHQTNLPSYDYLRRVLREAGRAGSFHRRYALVAVREALIGRLRLWEVWAPALGIEVRVCRRESDALRWLADYPEVAYAVHAAG